MNQNIREWPVPLVSRIEIEDEIARFLRTHRGGKGALLQLLSSLPPDRTEDEFASDCAANRAQHEAFVENLLDENNEHRRRGGLPPIDRKGNVIRK
jgi:hypothetical protein